VSTTEQGESGLGLDGQTAAIETTAARLGVPVFAIFTDSGISGAAGIESRPGLADCLNALRRGDVIIVSRRDRIARDAFLSVVIERECTRKGARIISASGEGTENDDATSIFVRRVLDAVAELERALIAARTRAAMAAARKRGRVVGRVPFGSRLMADGKHIEPDDHEQMILTELRWRRAEGFAFGTIAEMFNERGWRNRSGRPWRRQFLEQLLQRHGNGGLT
jgi:DNA invertase Pin-like site-specific DNA recombinase